MKVLNNKPKRISPYWINKEDWKTYIKLKNKELKEEDKINEYIANRFRIAHNLSSIVALGGMASALFIPILIMLFFQIDSNLGGKIFISWLGIAMLFIALFFFHQAYMGFRYKLTGTFNINKFTISKNQSGYIFAAVDEVRAPLWSIAMIILGIFLIAINILICIVFY
jgi:hypothetical protein